MEKYTPIYTFLMKANSPAWRMMQPNKSKVQGSWNYHPWREAEKS